MRRHLNPIQKLLKLGQSVWYDDISRALIETGGLQRLLDDGATGLTSNPTIFQKAISESDDYDSSLLDYARAGMTKPAALAEELAIEDIRAAADILRPVYDSAGGADGFASLEVNPHLAHDTDGTIAEARRLFAALGKPNAMIKVPATPEGIPAIRALIGEGINVNVTLIFSLGMYAKVRAAYIDGLETLAESGGDLSRAASVASFFVSRVDTAVDGLLEKAAEQDDNPAARALMGKAAVANAKLAYRDFKTTFGADRFKRLAAKGARAQRPLWASTSTKNPDYSDTLYIDSLIGADTVNTMPDATLRAFLDHGSPRATIELGVERAAADMDAIARAGVSMSDVTAQLTRAGVKAFADSFDALLKDIAAKRDRLMSRVAGA